MDKNLKAKWIKALVSGRYKQGQNFLRRGDKYCCLGVLCKIQRADFTELVMKSENIAPYHDGLTPGQCSELARMNDAGKTFTEIANFIEVNL